MLHLIRVGRGNETRRQATHQNLAAEVKRGEDRREGAVSKRCGGPRRSESIEISVADEAYHESRTRS